MDSMAFSETDLFGVDRGDGDGIRDLRRALGVFATGVTIVTTQDCRDRPVGLTANSFSSVSLTPPLVLWSQSRRAPSHSRFQGARHFVVNVLAADQIELSRRFAARHEDKFAGVEHVMSECGAPVLSGVAAHFECRKEFEYDGGDHVIFIGRVLRYAHTSKAPLLFCHGKYMRAHPHEHCSLPSEGMTQ